MVSRLGGDSYSKLLLMQGFCYCAACVSACLGAAAAAMGPKPNIILYHPHAMCLCVCMVFGAAAVLPCC